MDNLNELLARLHASKVEFVVVGGFAAVMHGATLVTLDVDICCPFNEENLLRLQSALTALHPVHRSRPDLPLLLTPGQCGMLKNLYLKTDSGALDCLSEVLGIGGYDDVFRESIIAELPFGECRVLDLDPLIRAKEAMGRDHDRVTVRQLKAIKEKRGEA
jgi:hypothetical protein